MLIMSYFCQIFVRFSMEEKNRVKYSYIIVNICEKVITKYKWRKIQHIWSPEELMKS